MKRQSSSRRLFLETLEDRCNPSAVDPLGGAMADVPAVDMDAAAQYQVLDTGDGDETRNGPPGQTYTFESPGTPINHDVSDLAPAPVGGVNSLEGATSQAGRGPSGGGYGILLIDTYNSVSMSTALDTSDPQQAAGTTQSNRLVSFKASDPNSLSPLSTGGAGQDLLIGGQDTIEDGARNQDNSHGTHVAGTVGAIGNNGLPHSITPAIFSGPDVNKDNDFKGSGLFHILPSTGNDMIVGGLGDDATSGSLDPEFKYVPVRRGLYSSDATDSTTLAGTDDVTDEVDDGSDPDAEIAVGGYIRVKKLTS